MSASLPATIAKTAVALAALGIVVLIFFGSRLRDRWRLAASPDGLPSGCPAPRVRVSKPGPWTICASRRGSARETPLPRSGAPTCHP